MKNHFPGIFFFMILLGACGESTIEKPTKLVSRDQMIKMLVDIHLAEAVYQTGRFGSEDISKIKESDYYYSILEKYRVADSTFEKSLIYYSGKPKEFEKIYTRVLNHLNEMEQENARKKQQPVDIVN
jgi:Domain of unknown function (DUF4296)